MKKFLKILAAASILSCGFFSVSYAEDLQKSFVDEIIFENLPFEENPTDEFLPEKQELNQLCMIENESEISSALHKMYVKFQDLKAKEVEKYGKEYVDWEVAFASNRLLAWNWELIFLANLQNYLSERKDEDFKTVLRDEETWNRFQADIDKINGNFSEPLEISFRMDKKFVDLCGEVFGENEPVALKRKIKLIQDYSLLGDSKFALEEEKNLLPKLEKAFGQNSPEVAEILNLTAKDYKTLGNYQKSEETLLKVIEINKQLYGEESSPKLVENFVDLMKLRKNASDVSALERAAKNLSDEELYKAGYFRATILNNPAQNMERLVKFSLACTEERNLMKNLRGEDYLKIVDMSLAQSENARALGLYEHSLTNDLIAMSDCRMNLGKFHYKTLTALCNLSEDYLAMNKVDDALSLARKAFETSQKIYGGNHPCTIYAIHALTDVYRKQKNFKAALNLDQKSYELCKQIFVKSSTGLPQENLTALIDIADDYKGLKDYPNAIKLYEEFLSESSSNNNSVAKVAEVQKNLARLYNLSGGFEKSVRLYDFLKDEENLYSLNGLEVDGLTAGHIANVFGEALEAVGKIDDAFYIYSQGIIQFERVRLINTGSTNENRREWFSQTVPYYKKAASFFVRQNEDDSAFRAVELCKGRTLSDQYRDSLAMYKGGLNESEILQLSDYRKKISQYKDRFGEEFKNGGDELKIDLYMTQLQIMENYKNYNRQLGEKYPKYDETLDSGRIDSGVRSDKFFNAEQLKLLLPKNHCYISFSVAKKDEDSDTRANEILAFVAGDDGKVKSFSISADDEFFNACNIYRDLLAFQNLDEMSADNQFLWKMENGSYRITNNLQRLAKAAPVKTAEDFEDAKKILSLQIGEKLLKPLTNYISEKETWIISPDGELNNIPFETLIFNGSLVVETKNVSYAPSLAVLKLMQEVGEKNGKISSRKELFAMGNAIYSNLTDSEIKRGKFKFFEDMKNFAQKPVELSQMKWKNLPGTNEELKKVSKFFQKNTRSILTKNKATERNLKNLDRSGDLSQYKLILFATHGLFLREQPELSSIVLTQGLEDEEFDGYVTVNEWLGYNLNSDLVYLSACESGLGDYQSGEGIIGIPYALTVAGNKDTVMSLWKVNDAATSEFTSAVFQKLSEGKSEIQALNETKREFLKNPDAKLNSPSVWAAFLLYGI